MSANRKKVGQGETSGGKSGDKSQEPQLNVQDKLKITDSDNANTETTSEQNQANSSSTDNLGGDDKNSNLNEGGSIRDGQSNENVIQTSGSDTACAKDDSEKDQSERLDGPGQSKIWMRTICLETKFITA